jgi:predicted nucleic acid-binding protein
VGSTPRSPASASPAGIPERRTGETSGVTGSSSVDTCDVLIDTASWINHGRIPDALIVTAIERGCVVTHQDVVGEITLGCGPTAVATAERIGMFRHATDVSHFTVLAFIRTHQLSCTGVGMVDARLIAACALADRPTRLYSADKRLVKEARRVGVSLT